MLCLLTILEKNFTVARMGYYLKALPVPRKDR